MKLDPSIIYSVTIIAASLAIIDFFTKKYLWTAITWGYKNLFPFWPFHYYRYDLIRKNAIHITTGWDDGTATFDCFIDPESGECDVFLDHSRLDYKTLTSESDIVITKMYDQITKEQLWFAEDLDHEIEEIKSGACLENGFIMHINKMYSEDEMLTMQKKLIKIKVVVVDQFSNKIPVMIDGKRSKKIRMIPPVRYCVKNYGSIKPKNTR